MQRNKAKVFGWRPYFIMKQRNLSSLDNLEVYLGSSRDSRGMLTFAEGMADIPFSLKRIFWITDIPVGSKRGGHAHKTCKEMVCCVSGSFRLVVDNGAEKRSFLLDNPSYAVIIPEGVWCSLEDFEPKTVVVVGASEPYSTEGYVRDYDEFIKMYGIAGRQD